MKKFLTAIVAAMFLLMSHADAEIQTYTGTGEYRMGDSDTPKSTERGAKEKALRDALERAGVYVSSYSEVEETELVTDKIISRTGAVLKILDTKVVWDGFIVRVTVQVEIDADELNRRLKNIDTPEKNSSPPPTQPKPPAVDNIALSQQKTEEGWKFWDEKNFNVAKNLFDEAIRLNSQNARAWYGRGTSYDELGQYEQAIQDLNKSIELNPNYAKAYNNRGNAYRYLKQYERAIQDYTRSIQLDPNYDKARNNRGLAYYKLKIYNKALEDFSKAIQLNPKYKKPYANRGRLYTATKDYWQALSDFDKAIKIDPKYSYAYWYRGKCYEALGEHDKARADFAKARQLGWKG